MHHTPYEKNSEVVVVLTTAIFWHWVTVPSVFLLRQGLCVLWTSLGWVWIYAQPAITESQDLCANHSAMLFKKTWPVLSPYLNYGWLGGLYPGIRLLFESTSEFYTCWWISLVKRLPVVYQFGIKLLQFFLAVARANLYIKQGCSRKYCITCRYMHQGNGQTDGWIDRDRWQRTILFCTKKTHENVYLLLLIVWLVRHVLLLVFIHFQHHLQIHNGFI